jgi:hypothetical protein
MEIRIGDSSYTIARPMNAFVQTDVLSKISPLLASGFGELVPLFMELSRLGISNVAEIETAKLIAIATPVTRELSRMTDEDRRFVFAACLTCVDRKREGDKGWAPVWNENARMSMFQDINFDAFLMLRITMGVIQETFTSFFSASLSALSGGAKF